MFVASKYCKTNCFMHWQLDSGQVERHVFFIWLRLATENILKWQDNNNAIKNNKISFNNKELIGIIFLKLQQCCSAAEHDAQTLVLQMQQHLLFENQVKIVRSNCVVEHKHKLILKRLTGTTKCNSTLL